MSNFYARYVPPAKKTGTNTEPAAQLNGSTKRKLPEQDLALREPKKSRSASVAELKKDDFGVKRFIPKTKKVRSNEEIKPIPQKSAAQPVAEQVHPARQDLLDKYRVTIAAKKSTTEIDVQIRSPVQKHASKSHIQDSTKPTSEPKPTRVKKKRQERLEDPGEAAATNIKVDSADTRDVEDGFEKHTAVRDRFKKAKKKSEQYEGAESTDGTQDTQKPELHGLEPLPQPPEVEVPYEPPSYSTLPPWLASADHIPQDAGVTFMSLGLSDIVLSNLKKTGLEKTLPIQSAVIPLLANGSTRYDGDLAVAAATGSGKTLAYVLPIVEALRNLAVTKLRGVIIVPTRELVKQVQETFNMCSEGTNLRAAIALGSKSVKEEAEALIESYEVYDPEAYAEQQSKMVDWTDFSVLELFERVKDGARQAPDHITKHRSKVDVLICTPGRLVEHLKTTKGFSLDDVQWLVIDEVDRLLNESYQEWIEVVTPALLSRRATVLRDEVLLKTGLQLPPRQITKIILSATMTKDLSKLNSLNLRNPRLLVLDGDSPEDPQDGPGTGEDTLEPIQDASGVFHLPSTLTEMAVMVGDGSDKPLHLLELLQTRIAAVEKLTENGTSAPDSDTSSSESSDDTSSSDSHSDASDSDSSTNANPTQSNTMKPMPTHSNTASTTSRTTPFPSTLIFTHSTSSAPRLARLLALLSPSLTSTTAVLTRSTASSSTSRRALKAFRTGTISILITTDRASRGLDIPNIEHVINYDVPGSVEAYVHRVGRTARAEKLGEAWSLVEYRQGRWFEGSIAKGDKVGRKGKVGRITLEGVGKGDMGKRYQEALAKLGKEVEGV
jgi:ATP-dependent RNA helicase DDX51/DBP6